ncbi:MAG: winged helix-turn-helix transcriptional regulator [Candidatus Nanoarchaeia archaeon]
MDKKDLQIMEILAQNCRIPNATIAQALRISKDTVAYRINALEKEGILKKPVLFVDARTLGFTRYHLLIKFDAGITDKEEVYTKMSKNKFVMWINTFIGRFDVQIIVDAKDSFQLNKIKENLFECCNHKIKEYMILTHICDLQFTHLNPVINLNTNFKKKADYSFSSLLCTKNFPVKIDFEHYALDKTEIKILNELSKNPKESLTDIGRKQNIDRLTVKKKIENLIKNKVIINFGGISDYSKHDFVVYYLLVRVEQSTPLSILKKPFEKLNNIFYAGKMLGDYDMILYLNARNPEELNSSIELFKESIEEHIIHYDLLVQDKLHHWQQFTPGIYEELLTKK